MKTIILVSALLLSGIAFAASPELPLLQRSLSPGFVPPQMQHFERCSVYADRLEIEKRSGLIGSVEVRNVKITGDVAALVAAAALGKLTVSPAPTDGPITSWVAYKDGKTVELKATGSSRVENSAPEALVLVGFLNQLCN